LLLFLSAILAITEYFYEKSLGLNINLFFVAVALASFAFGTIWYEFKDTGISKGVNAGEFITVKGIISEEPVIKEGYTEIVSEIFDENITVLIKTNNFPEYKYGDEIEIIGEIKKPKNFKEDFDYVSYLAKDGISYLFDKPKIKLVSNNGGSFLTKNLLGLKNTFLESIKTSFSEPHASLLSGLILGAKESLGKEWLEKFRISGLSHTIVLSGYNLTIIADAVMKIFIALVSRGASLFLGSLSIILFVIMTGGGAATVRAMIMSLIIMLSRATGRMYEAGNALILAGLFMVIHNPKVLVFDMSFQLSFLATLGLIYLSPIIKNKLNFLPEKFQFRELVATTLGAQLATAFLIIYKMGTFSIVSLPANLLTVVFIPATMFFGFFATLFNFFSYWLALPFIGIAWALLSYELFIVNFFSSLPFASVNVNFIQFLLGILFLSGFFIMIKLRKIKKENQWEIEEIK